MAPWLAICTIAAITVIAGASVVGLRAARHVRSGIQPTLAAFDAFHDTLRHSTARLRDATASTARRIP